MGAKYLVPLLFLLASCLPQSQVTKGNLASSSGNSGNGGSDVAIPASVTSWNFLAANTTSITINVSNLNNAYIVGSAVEKYLGTLGAGNALMNFTGADYCVVSNYSLGGIIKQLRSRVVPIAYYDFTVKRTVRVMRVDFDDTANSGTLCNFPLMIQSSNGNYITDSTPTSTPVYAPASLCPTCTSMLTATSVRVFKKEGLELKEVPKPLINLGSLALTIDPNSSAQGSAGSCSNAECKQRGFDCCLETQCVTDGAPRPSATTLYSTQYQIAEQERILNPLAYVNYPQIYYVCGTTVPPVNSGNTGGSNGGVDYGAGLAQLKKDYKCIQHIKAQATTVPFHNELLSGTYTATTDCLTSASDSGQTMYYRKVMERLYSTCGCAKTTLSDMISSCPAYEYTASLTDANGEPTKIDCYTPPTTVDIPTTRNVSLSSRSAPHRFFENNGGLEKDILGNERTYILGGTTYNYVQEGEAFSYLDDGFLIPNQKDFSMNAILGSMNVSLSQALPAKMVPVDIDQVYFLTTTSGYYTPCPSCAKDSWLSSLTAFPGSNRGAGLQAVGHSTERDSLSTNYTGGNYEDTIFGRACWIPPTMIPYGHSGKTGVRDQRLNRLETQAALFANGYQRDWFGFNKGALIGSFDGVTWFAIGKGRLVKSTSKKLFLAINAPFADVAGPGLHVVQVNAYDGLTQAASVDYDPQYHLSHPYQNEAGNCQANHLCNTDTDCITRLGWEYACADVKDLKTQWPTFDANGTEKPGSVVLTLDQILQQKRFPSSSSKRCVYRGAGAPCIRNSDAIADLNARKNLTCAPNFYCSSVNNAGQFNTQIARWAASLEDISVSRNHYFGKDANVLGRPLNYVGTGSLLSGIRQTLVENMLNNSSLATSNLGLCQPGKKLPDASNSATAMNPYSQHLDPDSASSKRTDFINQIAGCNSSFYHVRRYTSCPVLNGDGNYDMFVSLNLSTYPEQSRVQNSCGLDALKSGTNTSATADAIQASSPFKLIEARPLRDQTVSERSLVRDACLRKAGAVCHTDLDCSPNKMHADQVDYFAADFFGNEAEQNYHREYLICGQAEPRPLPSDPEAFKNYQMNKNRCCREVGKDLTTYTRDIPRTMTAGLGDTNYEPVSKGLKNHLASEAFNPANAGRYSRLSVVAGLGTSARPELSANMDRTTFTLPVVSPGAANMRTTGQWKTLNEVNSKTCCGGGWVRKFSDGSTDWSRRDRLFIDVNNFKCLNSRTRLLTDVTAPISSYFASEADARSLMSLDFMNYCRDVNGSEGSCAQYSIGDGTVPISPSTDSYPSSLTLNTLSPSFSGANTDVYFTPKSGDSNTAVIVDFSSTTLGARRNIVLRFPSYIPRTYDAALAYLPNGDVSAPVYSTVADSATPVLCTKRTGLVINSPTDFAGLCADNCCWNFDPATRNLKVVMNAAHSAVTDKKRVGVQFNFPSVGAGGPYGTLITRTRPGNNAFYLTRLGKLELSGIPQIGFEELLCNDDSSKLVPGIYLDALKTSTQFHSASGHYDDGDVEGHRVNMHALQSEPIFSANDFKCCAPLGNLSNSAARCCSGHGKPFGNGSAVKCMLPPGTDLMVYFNRFVTNEGSDSGGPGGGLTESDFNLRTGEPILQTSTNDKIRALGEAYCNSTGSTKTRQGGAFGLFEPEPAGPNSNLSTKIYGIVDSSRDFAQNNNAGTTMNVGYNAFMDGFRWNHHLYCND